MGDFQGDGGGIGDDEIGCYLVEEGDLALEQATSRAIRSASPVAPGRDSGGEGALAGSGLRRLSEAKLVSQSFCTRPTTIDGDRWLIARAYPGTRCEGLLMNARMVNGGTAVE